MGLGMGAGVSSVSIVIPSRAIASCGKGVVGASVLMFFNSIPLVGRTVNLRGEGQIELRRAICHVIGVERIWGGDVYVLNILCFVKGDILGAACGVFVT
jgi:hypothetical protein